MALTRKMLKGMGLTDEQIDTIIEGHDETVHGLKDQLDALKDKAGKADDLQKQVDAARNGKDWKAEHDKVLGQFDAYKKQVAAEAANAARSAEVKRLAKEAGLSEKGIEKAAKYTALDGIELGEDGKATNAADLVKNLRAEWPEYIVKAGTKPTGTKTPPEGQKPTVTREEVWAKDDHGRYKLTAAQRQQALMEHPELMQPGT